MAQLSVLVAQSGLFPANLLIPSCMVRDGPRPGNCAASHRPKSASQRQGGNIEVIDDGDDEEYENGLVQGIGNETKPQRERSRKPDHHAGQEQSQSAEARRPEK